MLTAAARKINELLPRGSRARKWAVGVALALPLAAAVGSEVYRRRQGFADLRRSTVLITGASSGIGESVASLLASHVGVHKLILVARRADQLSAVAKRINDAAGRTIAFAYAADASDGVAVDALFARLKVDGHERIDVCINCAGAGRYVELWKTPRAEVLSMLDAPLVSAAYFSRAVIPQMLARNSGTIVNVQSPASRTPFPGSTMYSTARWALRGLTESLRADLHGTRLRVLEVILGETSSAYFAANPGSSERIPAVSCIFPRITPAQAASGVLEGILGGYSGRTTAVYPCALAVALAFYDRYPGLMQWMVNVTGWSAKSQITAAA